jgi:sodium-dependent dicarboxylate transporter 2/3/5
MGPTMTEERTKARPAPAPSITEVDGDGHDQQSIAEILDVSKHKLSSVRTKTLTPTERWMQYLGFPLGILVFLGLSYMPTPAGLTVAAQTVLACFALALVWWITEPFPPYLTSICLLVLLVFRDVQPMEKVLGVLGMDVIWLNIMAFVLCSILLKTNLAKRLSLHLIVRFGKSALPLLFAFMVIQLALAPLIPATAARTIMTLPFMLVAAAIYGSTVARPNKFGKNLFQLNLFGISIFSSGFMTGSTCNIIAVAFLLTMGNTKVYYTDWMFAALPVAIIAMLAAWLIGPLFVFPLRGAQTKPVLTGGITEVAGALKEMGPMSWEEKKGAIIFLMVVFLWCTDRWQMGWFGFEIDEAMAAMIGVVLTFLPRYGVLKWNEADIPWHLLIFSCGAYAGGLALQDTGAARWAVGSLFDALHIGRDMNFWVVYVAVVTIAAYSHYLLTSKTMRTIILIPFIIGIAQQFGFTAISLALPAAFTLCWVIGLPISAKPNVILFSTGQYTVLDNLKYGFIVTTIAVITLIIAGFTWFRFLGITP